MTLSIDTFFDIFLKHLGLKGSLKLFSFQLLSDDTKEALWKSNFVKENTYKY